MIKRYAEQILINTKMNRPTIVGKSVLRPRLLARLDEGPQKRMTLISAPAGFGKTTVAVQWLDQHHGLSAWLSLEKNDSDPELFLRYLVAAIQSVVPTFGKQIWSLVNAVKLPPPDYLADAMISELTSLSEPVLIVLDDYHSIVSDDVQKIVSRMLTHLPDKVHIVILTRKDPPWPIGRWRTLAWINELRAADLNFSREETETLVMESNFSAEIVDLIQRQTEGWIAGLKLLLISLAGQEDPGQFAKGLSGSDRLIEDFLMEEVIAHQPREILDFLTISSMFDRFCAPLCDFLLADVPDREPSDKTIAYLERENLFLIQLDRDRRWYRYHHLFQNLLKQYLIKKMSRERMGYLYRRAGEWFSGQAMNEEAIRYFISAGDLDSAAGLIETHLHDIIDGDLSRRRLGRLLDAFPKQAERTRPFLLVAHSYAQLFRWNFAEAMKMLDQIDSFLKDTGDTFSKARRNSLQGDFDAQKAFCLYWQGDAAGALSHALRALQLVPKYHRYAYSLALVYAAGAYAISGRKEKALSLLAETLMNNQSYDFQYAGASYVAQMVIHYYAGDLNAVQETVKQMLLIHETVPLPDYWLSYGYFFQGSVAYERNQLNNAKDLFEVVRKMPYRVPPPVYYDCLVGLTLVALAKGKVHTAREYQQESANFTIKGKDPYIMQMSQEIAVRLALLSGKVPVTTLALTSTVESNKFWLLVPSLVRAENAILRGTQSECSLALQSIDEALRRAEEHHNIRQTIQFLAVKAVAMKCVGKTAAALHVLEKTLHRARPLGFIRTFIDRGPLMAELLAVLLKKKPRDRYVRSLLIAFNAEKAQHERTDDLPDKSYRETSVQTTDSTLQDELTNREIEILLLLEQRLSNKEISNKLFISPETVKRHTINIYHKLKVNNRRAAIVASKKFGFIGFQHPAS